MDHEVFISYSTQDKTIADAVCHSLEESSTKSPESRLLSKLCKQ